MVRWGKRILKWLFYATLAYVAIVLIGLIPVNNDFAETDDGITVYVVSNEVHADIIVPVKTSIIDWSEELGGATFVGDVSLASHAAFGWGDKGFFLETETWDDFKLSVAANALLLPSESCMHVVQISGRAYSTTDAFFEANGRYHLLNTCNSWVGRGLKSAGVRVPWLSPMPKTPMLYFEPQ